MKRIPRIFSLCCIITMVITMMTGCGKSSSKQPSAPYWRVDLTSTFWGNEQKFADAFTFCIPDYMVQTFECEEGHQLKNDSLAPGQWQETTFRSDSLDCIHDGSGYISVFYLKGHEGSFPLCSETPSIQDTLVVDFLDGLVEDQLTNRTEYWILDRRLLHIGNDQTAFDVCYKTRTSPDPDTMINHIFVLNNYIESVEMVISYKESQHSVYKGLFNIITSFKWKKKHKPITLFPEEF